MDRVPTKLAFFAWEAAWGKVLTLDRLQKRGWQLPNRCFLCGSEEENANHLLIHCTVVRVPWEIVLGLFGAQWVFPETVKEVLLSFYLARARLWVKRGKKYGDPFRYLFFGWFGRRGID